MGRPVHRPWLYSILGFGVAGTASQPSGELKPVIWGIGPYRFIYKTLMWLWAHRLFLPIPGILEEDPNMSWYKHHHKKYSIFLWKIRIKTPQILGFRRKSNNAYAYLTTISRPFETVNVYLTECVLKSRKVRQQTNTRPDVIRSWEILHTHSQDTRVVLFGDIIYVLWSHSVRPGSFLVSVKLRLDAGIG